METTPRMFCFFKQFCLKNHHVAKDTFNETDEFCWQLKDGINDIVENQIKFDCSVNLSTKEKRALHKLIAGKNTIHVFNDKSSSQASHCRWI